MELFKSSKMAYLSKSLTSIFYKKTVVT